MILWYVCALTMTTVRERVVIVCSLQQHVVQNTRRKKAPLAGLEPATYGVEIRRSSS